MGRGRSRQTTNYYTAHLKTFCRWMVKDKRLPENPFEHLKCLNTKVDRRHDRRELDTEELRHLLTTTRENPRSFRGLSGNDRFVLYMLAASTGFRAGALSSLTRESFNLETDPATVTLSARRNKKRKPRVQPLPSDVVPTLREFLATRPAGVLLWGGTWASDHRGAEMFRNDLEASGIPYSIQGPDGQLFADFHSLRHSFLTLLGRGGVDLRTVQELADHSTPMLTARYVHRRF